MSVFNHGWSILEKSSNKLAFSFWYQHFLYCFELRTMVLICVFVSAAAPPVQEGNETNYKDWVFINYTFKRFEGLTQRGTPTKKWPNAACPSPSASSSTHPLAQPHALI
jgi:hypothetical protein